MQPSGTQPNHAFAGEARGGLSPRAARALWWGSGGLVLGVLGTSVLVAGAEHGQRPPAAVVLVLAQACALRWQTRAPMAVLAVNALTGLAVWADPNGPSSPHWSRQTAQSLAPDHIVPTHTTQTRHHCTFWNALG
ncbi:hypothetical protein [Streptomyces sp. CoH27]|uniref:hypothetical protein n=1 Tax=Streptomyces sp. CoH27 TaxID=2875763 RepID=UPI0027E1348B|nr:hypothetical protein [Streptomyces sp. CoH27]